jgi:hypothetical protein
MPPHAAIRGPPLMTAAAASAPCAGRWRDPGLVRAYGSAGLPSFGAGGGPRRTVINRPMKKIRKNSKGFDFFVC